MNRALLYYAVWLLAVPFATTFLMQFVSGYAAGGPWVIALNASILLAVGFFSVSFLPGRLAIRFAVLLVVPVWQYLFYSGQREPGFAGLNLLILGVEAGLLWLGGFASAMRKRVLSSDPQRR